MTQLTAPTRDLFISKQTVPVCFARFGSWEIGLRRHVHKTADLATHYDVAASSWNQTAARFGLVGTYRRALQRGRFGKHQSPKTGTSCVLDCGIGTGSLTLALSQLCRADDSYFGIDTSTQMLEHADRSLRQRDVSCQLKEGSIEAIPYNDASFDIVMAAHVLEHLPDPAVGLQEMVRVLKPGGKLFICITRPSLFGAFIQMRWRTWAVSERQGLTWLRQMGLRDFGLCPLPLGSLSGNGSTAFWASKPDFSMI